MNRKSSRRKRLVWIVVLVVVAAGAAVGVTAMKGKGKAKGAGPVVKVERGADLSCYAERDLAVRRAKSTAEGDLL